MSSGWNPNYGWEAARGNAGAQVAAYNPYQGYAGAPRAFPVPMQGPGFAVPQYGPYGQTPPLPVFPGEPARLPNPAPHYNTDCPASVMVNSTGGVGCEPGYNMFFSPEYTKVHVLKTREAPWRVPAGMSLSFGAFHVPSNTCLAELLKGFGATNPIPKKNRITEILQGHGGRWYKGMTISGEEADMMEKTLNEMGWDRLRTGRPGEKPVVWLWITKD